MGAEEVWHGGPASVPFHAVVFDCSSPPLQMSHTGADSTAARPRSANIAHVCRQPLPWVFVKHLVTNGSCNSEPRYKTCWRGERRGGSALCG